MATLTDIDGKAPSGTALLRVFRNSCSLNRQAMRLLGLQDKGNVRFRTPRGNGNRRVYVSSTQQAGGYGIHRRGGIGIVNSRSLAATLAMTLQGTGTYRICEEDTVTDDMDGTTCYAIFFRKYE